MPFEADIKCENKVQFITSIIANWVVFAQIILTMDIVYLKDRFLWIKLWTTLHKQNCKNNRWVLIQLIFQTTGMFSEQKNEIN